MLTPSGCRSLAVRVSAMRRRASIFFAPASHRASGVFQLQRRKILPQVSNASLRAPSKSLYQPAHGRSRRWSLRKPIQPRPERGAGTPLVCATDRWFRQRHPTSPAGTDGPWWSTYTVALGEVALILKNQWVLSLKCDPPLPVHHRL